MSEDNFNLPNQTVPNQQPSQRPMESQVGQEEQKEESRTSSSLNAILFEVLFVGIVIVLLFGTLNYFNILRLSELFPNQLGWLPHRQQSQQFNPVNPPLADNGAGNTTIAPTIAPPISPTQQAKQTLINALPNILAPVLIPNPSQITIEQDKGLGKAFISSWDIKESTVAAIVVITDNKTISQLYLSFQRPQNTQPSVQLASTITSELFSVKPKGVWGCKPVFTTMTYCENFWEEKDGTRKGLGMEGLFTQGPNAIRSQPEAMLIFCEHGKESKIYSWKSCQFEFAKTGVQ